MHPEIETSKTVIISSEFRNNYVYNLLLINELYSVDLTSVTGLNTTANFNACRLLYRDILNDYIIENPANNFLDTLIDAYSKELYTYNSAMIEINEGLFADASTNAHAKTMNTNFVNLWLEEMNRFFSLFDIPDISTIVFFNGGTTTTMSGYLYDILYYIYDDATALTLANLKAIIIYCVGGINLLLKEVFKLYFKSNLPSSSISLRVDVEFVPDEVILKYVSTVDTNSINNRHSKFYKLSTSIVNGDTLFTFPAGVAFHENYNIPFTLNKTIKNMHTFHFKDIYDNGVTDDKPFNIQLSFCLLFVRYRR